MDRSIIKSPLFIVIMIVILVFLNMFLSYLIYNSYGETSKIQYADVMFTVGMLNFVLCLISKADSLSKIRDTHYVFPKTYAAFKVRDASEQKHPASTDYPQKAISPFVITLILGGIITILISLVQYGII